MAAIPKGRIVLYVILGIIVIVLGIYMLSLRSKEARLAKGRRLSTEDIPATVQKLTKQANEIEEDLAGLSGPEVDQARQLLAQARQGLTDIQTLTDGDAITKKREEIKDALTEARKLKNRARKGQ